MNQQLEQAAKLIEEFVGGLERSTSICDCCGATRWKNRNHYQMGIELDAVVTKLKRFSKSLE